MHGHIGEGRGIGASRKGYHVRRCRKIDASFDDAKQLG
jgi:hypothetical protein